MCGQGDIEGSAFVMGINYKRSRCQLASLRIAWNGGTQHEGLGRAGETSVRILATFNDTMMDRGASKICKIYTK